MNQRLQSAGDLWPRFAAGPWRPASSRCTRCRCACAARRSGPSTSFAAEVGALDDADVAVGQAFADVATIAILQHRAAAEAHAVKEQLMSALNSRIDIEQAKGVIAERAGLDMDQAFDRLRNHARNHNLRLVDVARDVIDGTVVAEALDPLSGDPKR